MLDVDVPFALKAFRINRGFSQKQIAQLIGVPASAIADCERRSFKTHYNQNTFYTIKTFLEGQEQINLHFSFLEGHYYSIYNPSINSNQFGRAAYSSSSDERDYTFIYLRKEGIHHVFREINGGWTRTYTDAQLVGKKIIEVSE